MINNSSEQQYDDILLDWLRENKELYKKAPMARKLGIPIETLECIQSKKPISARYMPQIKERLIKFLLHDNEFITENGIVLKLYVLSCIETYKSLPWLNEGKQQVYDSLVILQNILIGQAHPLRFFVNAEVLKLSKECTEKAHIPGKKKTVIIRPS